jgi:hypothetical protein
MDQCASIYLDVSLDGLGSVNDWYRWPSKFTEVQQVMDQYNEWWGTKDNVTLTIHSVISVYNIFTLDQFIMFMTNNYPKWELDWDWVSGREWQMLSIIPPNQKILLTRQLTEWESTIQGNWNIDKGNPFKRSIVELLKTPKSDIKEFWERSLSLAKERNLDILKMVPDITRLLEDSVDVLAQQWEQLPVV